MDLHHSRLFVAKGLYRKSIPENLDDVLIFLSYLTTLKGDEYIYVRFTVPTFGSRVS